jgi:hypothetical protein
VLHAPPISFFSIWLPGPRLVHLFRNVILFYCEELLAPRPAPKLEDHPLSAVCDWLFNVFGATLHNWRPSSIRNQSMRHAVVTGTHLTRPMLWFEIKIFVVRFEIFSLTSKKIRACCAVRALKGTQAPTFQKSFNISI